MNNDSNNNNKTTEVKSGRHWPRGIGNEVGTCYLSTALQCLLALDVVRERYAYPTICIHGDLSLEIELLFAERCERMLSDQDTSEPPHTIFNILYGEKPNFSKVCAIFFNLLPNIMKLLMDYGKSHHDPFKSIFEIISILDKERDRHCKFNSAAVLPPEIQKPLMGNFIGEFETVVTCASCGCIYYIPFDFHHMAFNSAVPTIYLDYNKDIIEILFKDTPEPIRHCRWLTLHDLLPYIEFPRVRNMRCVNCKKKYIDESTKTLNAHMEFSILKAPPVFVLYLPYMRSHYPGGCYDPRIVPANAIDLQPYLDLTKYIKYDSFYEDDNIPNYRYKLCAMADYLGAHSGEHAHTRANVCASKYGLTDSSWYIMDDELPPLSCPE